MLLDENKEARLRLSAALEKAASWEANSHEKQRALEMMTAHNKVRAYTYSILKLLPKLRLPLLFRLCCWLLLAAASCCWLTPTSTLLLLLLLQGWMEMANSLKEDLLKAISSKKTK